MAGCVTQFPKRLNDIIASAWKFNGSANSVKEKRIPRMDRIKLAVAEPCVAGCNGCNSQWHKCAAEVLLKNAIHPVVFASALQKLLLERRGKYGNILITGPANCAKIFILN